jgi:hypothetical protein
MAMSAANNAINLKRKIQSSVRGLILWKKSRRHAIQATITLPGHKSKLECAFTIDSFDIVARHFLTMLIAIFEKLIAWTMHIKLLKMNEAFGMNQSNGTGNNACEAKLISRKSITNIVNRTTCIAFSELGGNYQDVALLRLGDLIQRLRRVSMNP